MVEVGFAREGGGDSFFEELDDFDEAFVGVVVGGDFELVTGLEFGGGFEGVAVAFDFSVGAVV